MFATTTTGRNTAPSPTLPQKGLASTSFSRRALDEPVPALLPQFTMAFQPIVDVRERRIAAYEALVRGPAGEDAADVLRQVPPDRIHAFDHACRIKAIETAARLGTDRELSVNFMPDAIFEPENSLRSTVQAASAAGLPAHRLIFEILETQAIIDCQQMLRIMRQYRKCGFRLALDDFGNGHSGLLRLVELKPDIVKIDRVFTQACDRDATRLAVIAAVLGLCATIGVRVVVEGAETAGEVHALRSVGVRFIQGYYFAKPLANALCGDADIAWPS